MATFFITTRKSVQIFVLFLTISGTFGCSDQTSKSITTGPAESTDSLYRKKKDPEIESHLACAIETCGPAETVPSESAPIKDSDRRYYKKEHEPEIKKMVELNIQTLIRGGERFREFAKLELNEISDTNKAFLNFFFLQQFWKEIAQSTKSTAVGDIINSERLEREVEKHLKNPIETKWVVNASKQIFEMPFYVNMNRLSSYPFELFIETQYPNIGVLYATAMLSATLERLQDRILRALPLLKLSSNFDSGVLKKASRLEPLTAEEQSSLQRKLLAFTMLDAILPGGRWHNTLISRNFDLAKLTKQAYEKALKSPDFQVTSTSPLLKVDSQKVIEFCENKLGGLLSSSPTQAQLSSFESVMEKARHDAIAIVSRNRYESVENQQILETVKFIKPPNKEQVKQELKRQFSEEFSAFQNRFALIDKLNPESQPDRESLLLMAVANYLYKDEFEDQNEDEDHNILSHVEGFCKSNGPKSLEDAAYSSFGTVVVGWRSVLFPEYGYEILAHELGHIVSNHDSKSHNPKFLRVKECLNENKNGQQQYIEEDFADLFAVQLMKGRSESRLQNFSCLLLQQSKNGTGKQYQSLKLHEDDEDSHSESFYRLIAVGSGVQKLAPSCQAVKNSSEEGKRWKDCWEQ